MLFLNTQENVDGIAIFSYRHLKEAYVNSSSPKGVQVAPILEHCWNDKTILPTLSLYDSVILEKVPALYIQKNDSGYKVIFSKQNEAKFYAIYRTSAMQLEYTNEELIATIGGKSKDGYYSYQDEIDEGNYLYGVRPISKNNTLGEANIAYSIDPYYKVTFKDHNGEVIATTYVSHGTSAEAPELDFVPEGYHFTGWSLPITNIISDIETQALFEKDIIYYTVTFLGINKEVITIKEVPENSEVIYPEPALMIGYTFTGWDKTITHVMQDETITAIYEQNQYRVRFYDGEDLLKEMYVEHGGNVEYPDSLEKEGYMFVGWDHSLVSITETIDIKAIYERIKYTIQFLDENSKIIDAIEVDYHDEFTLMNPPEKEGYTFSGWSADGKTITATTLVAVSDMDIVASYMIKSEEKGCNQINLFYVSGLLMVIFILRKRRYI